MDFQNGIYFYLLFHGLFYYYLFKEEEDGTVTDRYYPSLANKPYGETCKRMLGPCLSNVFYFYKQER